MAKSRIAVFMGGRSVEHDVSVLSGLQFIEALDPDEFDGLLIYVAADGRWFTGDALRKRSFYPLKAESEKRLRLVAPQIGLTSSGRAAVVSRTKGLMGEKSEEIPFDIAVSAIHGSSGEDGALQGLFEFWGVPFAGSGVLGSAATMDKAFAKSVFRALEIPTLKHVEVRRDQSGAFNVEAACLRVEDDLAYSSENPVCVKPRNLGSSIGVSRAASRDELAAALLAAMRLDSAVIIEPFVQNLVEYNVAVRCGKTGTIKTSAIERPMRQAELLDFKEKYLAGSTGGPKLDAAPSEGMASLNRVLNPEELSGEQEAFIRRSAAQVFDTLDLAGSVRIDFMGDSISGDLWINEVNTIPGSFAFFLWEAAAEPLTFTELASAMIREAHMRFARAQADRTAEAGGGTIFQRDYS